MGKLNIHIADEDQDWLERQGNASGVISDLVSAKRHEDAYTDYLKKEVEEGFASGDAEGTVEEIFAEAVSEWKKSNS